MLTQTSKVHDLFTGMDSVLKHKKDFDKYAGILREMIRQREIHGRMSLCDFFKENTARNWLGFVEREYDIEDAREMYSIVLDIPRDFDVIRVPRYNEETDTDETVVAASKKQAWMDSMRPLAKEYASKEVSAEAIMNVIWETLECKNEDMKTLFQIGKILYANMD